jgi:hypothetical protein
MEVFIVYELFCQASPTTADPVSIKISGNWPNSCIPQNPAVRRLGNEVSIITSNLAGVCAQVLTPWSYTLDIGQLAAGAYKATVTHTSPEGQEGLGSKSFYVLP